MIALDRGHDRAAIGPRSRRDRSSIVDFPPAIDLAIDSAISSNDSNPVILLSPRRSPSIAQRSCHDRATIGLRSRGDQGLIVDLLLDVVPPSDGDRTAN